MEFIPRKFPPSLPGFILPLPSLRFIETAMRRAFLPKSVCGNFAKIQGYVGTHTLRIVSGSESCNPDFEQFPRSDRCANKPLRLKVFFDVFNVFKLTLNVNLPSLPLAQLYWRVIASSAVLFSSENVIDSDFLILIK